MDFSRGPPRNNPAWAPFGDWKLFFFCRTEGIDVGYWESLLSQLKAHLARARLRDRHSENLRKKLELLKAEQLGGEDEEECDADGVSNPYCPVMTPVSKIVEEEVIAPQETGELSKADRKALKQMRRQEKVNSRDKDNSNLSCGGKVVPQ